MKDSGKPVGVNYNLLEKNDIEQKGRNCLSNVGKAESERPWRNTISAGVEQSLVEMEADN